MPEPSHSYWASLEQALTVPTGWLALGGETFLTEASRQSKAPQIDHMVCHMVGTDATPILPEGP